MENGDSIEAEQTEITEDNMNSTAPLETTTVLEYTRIHHEAI
jgi:hypothetical protein